LSVWACGAVWAFMVTDPSVHPEPIPVFMPDRSERSRWTETRRFASRARNHMQANGPLAFGFEVTV
jgi:hypothetical protein